MSGKVAHNIPAPILEILRKATIADHTLTLGPDQLDPKVYKDVDKVIKMYGGKWNRSKRCHDLLMGGADKLRAALGSGVAVNEKNLLQKFYTPTAVAERAIDFAEISRDGAIDRRGLQCLEPNVGEGAIGKCILERGALLTAVDIDPVALAKFRAWTEESPLTSKRVTIEEGDFLTVAPKLRHFDRVVMNPPFTGGQDIAHITAAFECLKPGGILVAVCPPSVLMNSTKAYTAFQALLAGDRLEWEKEDLPPGSFKESGTNIDTILLKLARF